MLASIAGALPLRQRAPSEVASPTALAKEREANLVTPTPFSLPDRASDSRTPKPGLDGLRTASSAARRAIHSGFSSGGLADISPMEEQEEHATQPPTSVPSPSPAFTAAANSSRARLLMATAYDSRPSAYSPVSEDGALVVTDSPTRMSDSLGRRSLASSRSGLSDRRGSEQGVTSGGGDEYSSAVGSGSGYDSASKKRKKKLAAIENLVIVRPPPSKQSNPLNLQIQLVTPQGPTPANRTSGEFSRNGDEVSVASSGKSGSPPRNSLRRSSSVLSHGSQRSEASAASSSLSMSLRRVTPLYNLNFHTLLPTTISDAVTDDKVAKFGRRGIDLDGFGLLEPHELIRGVNDLASIEQMTGSGLDLAVPNSPLSSLHGESNGAASESDSAQAMSQASDHSGSVHALDLAPTSFDAMTPEAQTEAGLGAKFMNRFKRMSFQNRQPSAASSSASSVAPSNGALSRQGSKRASIDSASRLNHLRPPSAAHLEVPQLVVGAGLSPDGGRKAEGYYWVVRKWTRQHAEEGDQANARDALTGPDGQNEVLSNVWRRFNLVNRMGGFERHPPVGQIPVRFEWTKDSVATDSALGASRRSSRTSANRRSYHGRSTTEGSAVGLSTSPLPRAPQAFRGSFDIAAAVNGRSSALSANGHSNETSPEGSAVSGPAGLSSLSVSNASAATPGRASSDGPAVVERQDSGVAGDADESDPEDSETTWSCHLVLGPTTRIPLGSLAPAPHHPKLVAQLQIPFPLPDLSATGLGVDGAGLTREELKDIVSVTCLFLVIRQGMGGLSKRRRGDMAWKLGLAQHQV